MPKVMHVVALVFHEVESINTDLSGAGLVPDFKIKCKLCANLPAIAHCRILLGLTQWDLALDTPRILSLGFYLLCLRVSQLSVQRETQTISAVSLEHKSPHRL